MRTSDLYAGWFVVPQWKLAIGAAPKVGTRAIMFTIAHYYRPDLEYKDIPTRVWKKLGLKHGFYQRRMDQVDSIPSNHHRIGVIRDPVERFASLWRCQIRDKTAGILAMEGMGKITTQKDLIDVIERQPHKNVHWMHQHELIEKADEIVTLDQLSQRWQDHCGVEFRVVNTTTRHEPVSDDIAERVNKFYSRDRELFLGVAGGAPVMAVADKSL